jgi:hypothetical protein
VAAVIAGVLALLGLGFALRSGEDSSPPGQPTAAGSVGNAAEAQAPTDEEAGNPEDAAAAAPPLSAAERRLRVRELNISRAVRAHWKRRLARDASSLAAAYDAYVGPVRRRAGTRARWMRGIREDGLRDMAIRGVLVRDVTAGSARAMARVRTESDEGGCADWVMHYTIHLVAGRWRIWDSAATKTEC